MSFRSAQIFVQPLTAKLLRLVTKLYPARTETPVSGQSYDVQSSQTPDERADSILQTAIALHYPLAIELAKKQDELEKEFTVKAKEA